MYDAVLYKFSQNLELAKKLLAIGREEFVEETTKENYWGCGPNKDGRNNYGKILYLVRSKLRGDSVNYYTVEGMKKLLDEFHSIDDIHDKVTREMGESNARDNDLRENHEYMELRVKAMYDIPKEKQALADKIRTATIIEDTPEYKNWDETTVSRKCNVCLSIDGDEDEEYIILGSNEGDINKNILSCEAPLVLSLLNHKVGDIVKFNDMEIEIKNVSRIKTQSDTITLIKQK